LAAFCYPTRTEAQKLKLIAGRPKWDRDRSIYDAWNETYLALPAPLVALVEVKTTKEDFCRDSKFTRDIPAHAAYLAIPRKLIDPASVSESWGVLVVDGDRATQIRPPKVQPIPVERALSVIAQIALRRDSHTRYERWRALSKELRQGENARVNRDRMSRAVSIVTKVVRGEMSAEEVLSAYSHRCETLPKYVVDELRQLAPRIDLKEAR
jgi:hypothetical protein